MGIMSIKTAIVIGCGAFGLSAANMLSDAEFEVTAIDKDPSVFTGLDIGFGGQTVIADGSDIAALEAHGLADASLVFASTDADSINYLIARIASDIFGVGRVFARIEDEDLASMLEEGTAQAICPHKLCVNELRQLADIR